MTDEFQQPFFGCLNDTMVCLLAAIVPCYQGALNTAKIDERDCNLCDCCCWVPNVEYYTRQRVREKYAYPNDEFMDGLLICFCTQCVICQDAIEMQSL